MNKTTAKIVDRFDDPVGNWCQCNNCIELFFVPLFDPTDMTYTINNCAKCGYEITNIKKILIDVL